MASCRGQKTGFAISNTTLSNNTDNVERQISRKITIWTLCKTILTHVHLNVILPYLYPCSVTFFWGSKPDFWQQSYLESWPRVCTSWRVLSFWSWARSVCRRVRILIHCLWRWRSSSRLIMNKKIKYSQSMNRTYAQTLWSMTDVASDTTIGSAGYVVVVH